METYCGKCCETCIHRETLGCTGCKCDSYTPRVCEIARCCREKGHWNCNSCQFVEGCYRRQQREHISANRQRQVLLERQELERLSKRAGQMGNWLWLLFWLMIPTWIGNFLTGETVEKLFSGLYWAGVVILVGCYIGKGVILFKLAPASRHYRICAWMYVGSVMLEVGVALIPDERIANIVTLIACIPSLLYLYHYYHGHMDVLSGYKNGLKEKWEKLWKWYLICYLGGIIGGALLAFIVSGLGALIVLAGSIGVLVLSVMEIIYLYQTAKFFRDYSVDPALRETYYPFPR